MIPQLLRCAYLTNRSPADGCIRVYRDYDTPKPFLVTAWRALTHLIPTTQAESGLVLDWQQGRGRLLVGGNARDLKIWDAPTEVCTRVCLVLYFAHVKSCIMSDPWSPGNRHTVKFLCYESDFRSSRWRYRGSRLWRWCIASVRQPTTSARDYGESLERLPPLMGQEGAYAAWRQPGAALRKVSYI